jgi:crossover junction endodeoxyribonuclease RusA
VTTLLELPFPPKELSPNARVHRLRKADATRLYKGECLALAWSQIGRKPTTALLAPVTAQTTFVVTTNRKRDEDNLSASIKALWDALVRLGLLVGDDAAVLHHAPVTIEKGKKACVRVRLESAS